MYIALCIRARCVESPKYWYVNSVSIVLSLSGMEWKQCFGPSYSR